MSRRVFPRLEGEVGSLPSLHTPLQLEAALCCSSQEEKALLTPAECLHQGEPPQDPPVALSLVVSVQTCALVAKSNYDKGSLLFQVM